MAVLVLLLLAMSVAMGQTNYYVSTGGDDGLGDGSDTKPWKTIQHAIDNATGLGIVIHVAAGEYELLATVTIDKSLTIQGQGQSADETLLYFSSIAQDPVNNPERLRIAADYVHLKNFHLRSPFNKVYHQWCGGSLVDVVHKGGVGTSTVEQLYTNIALENMILEGGLVNIWVNAENFTLRNCELRSRINAIQGRMLRGTTLIENNRFVGGPDCNRAFVVEGASNIITRGAIVLADNIMDRYKNFVLLNMYNFEGIDSIYVADNMVNHQDRAGSSVVLMAGDYEEIEVVLIKGNEFYNTNSEQLGVYLDYEWVSGGSLPASEQVQIHNNMMCVASPWGKTTDVVDLGIPVGFSTGGNTPLGMTLGVFGLSGNTSECPPVFNATKLTYHSTIQNAISSADPGDVIEVAAGNYANVGEINKPVTLRGANAGIPAAEGSGTTSTARGDETVMTGGFHVFRPKASNITIDGFKFTGSGGRLVDTYADSDNLTIQNCVFDIPSGAGDGGVIQLGGGSKENLIIKNNRFDGIGTSSWLYFAGTNYRNVVIEENDFVGTGARGMFQAGAADFTNALIKGNYFGSGIVTGINMGDLGSPIIEQNTFVGVKYAAMQVGTYPFNDSGGHIRNNNLDGTGSSRYFDPPYDYTLAYGIQVWGGAWGTKTCEGLVISDNVVKNYYNENPGIDDYYVGIYLPADAGPDIAIYGNNIEDNRIGIRINTDKPGIIVTNNTIIGNTTGILNQKTETLDARGNWWGHTTGPYHDDTNTNGEGDEVSDYVLFDPWIRTDEVTATSPTTYPFDTDGNSTADVTLNFSTLPPGGGNVFVYRSSTLPYGWPDPPAGVLPLYLEITSDMPNYSFELTVTLTELPTGFDEESVVMYFNTSSQQWVPLAGNYVETPESFSFTANHFTAFAFADGTAEPEDYHNTAGTAYDLFVTGDPEVTGDNVIYPNNNWDLPDPLPAGYPDPAPENDWGFTGAQALSVYIVPEVDAEFGASYIDVQWSEDILGDVTADYTGSIYNNALLAVAQTFDWTNRIRLDASMDGVNFDETLEVGDYIAKLNFELLRPGSSQIDVIGADLRWFGLDEQLYVWSKPNNATVKAYLGDVAHYENPEATTPVIDESSGDGKIDLADLTVWSESYWSGVPGYEHGMTYYKVKFDIGPTSTNYVDGLPEVDGKIEFEDLMIFAINYGRSMSNNLMRAAPVPDVQRLAVSELTQANGITELTLALTDHPVDLRGLSLRLNGSFGMVLSAEYAGNTEDVSLFHLQHGGDVLVDLAVLGGDRGIASAGDVLTLRFSGTVRIDGISGLARDSRNNNMRVLAAVAPIADGIELAPNYPNPFNPVTNISFSVPESMPVRLEIYDQLGRRIAVLRDGYVNAGVHTVQWHSLDSYGRIMPSGMYIYRLTAGGSVLQRTMLLNK